MYETSTYLVHVEADHRGVIRTGSQKRDLGTHFADEQNSERYVTQHFRCSIRLCLDHLWICKMVSVVFPTQKCYYGLNTSRTLGHTNGTFKKINGYRMFYQEMTSASGLAMQLQFAYQQLARFIL